MIFAGAQHAPMPQTKKASETPTAPSVSSTILPNTQRLNRLPLRCAKLAWQNKCVPHCHHCGLRGQYAGALCVRTEGLTKGSSKARGGFAPLT